MGTKPTQDDQTLLSDNSQPIEIHDPVTLTSSQPINPKHVVYFCSVCRKDTSRSKQVIKCTTCNHAVHYSCSRLPKYVLYTFTKKKTKRFDCETCTKVPTDFQHEDDVNHHPMTVQPEVIPTIIVTDENGDNLVHENVPPKGSEMDHAQRPEVGASLDDRRIAQLNDLFEKYDFCTMAENLLILGNKMEAMTLSLDKNIRKFDSTLNNNTNFNNNSNNNNSNNNNSNSSSSNNNNNNNSNNDDDHSNSKRYRNLETTIKNIKDELEFTRKDRDSYRTSYELLLVELKAADEKSWNLAEKERNLANLLGQRDIAAAVQEKELEKNKVLIEDLEKKITEMTDRYCDIHSKWEKGHMANEILGLQLDSYATDKKNLEKKLETAILKIPTASTSTPPNPMNQKGSNSSSHQPQPQPTPEMINRCTILHDSLVKKVNDTLLRREGVGVNKVWAPDFKRMEEEIDKMQPTETIVVQAFTRAIDKLEIDDMYKHIDNVVTKAKTKAKKIVIPTIVYREDIPNLWRSIDMVNAYIFYKYDHDNDIVIADNSKLKDATFRCPDKLHLTDAGTSVLASNLKYGIANALNVKVVKKVFAGSPGY